MYRVITNKKIFFIGKIDELLEAIEDLQSKYATLKEAIDDLLGI